MSRFDGAARAGQRPGRTRPRRALLPERGPTDAHRAHALRQRRRRRDRGLSACRRCPHRDDRARGQGRGDAGGRKRRAVRAGPGDHRSAARGGARRSAERHARCRTTVPHSARCAGSTVGALSWTLFYPEVLVGDEADPRITAAARLLVAGQRDQAETAAGRRCPMLASAGALAAALRTSIAVARRDPAAADAQAARAVALAPDAAAAPIWRCPTHVSLRSTSTVRWRRPTKPRRGASQAPCRRRGWPSSI